MANINGDSGNNTLTGTASADVIRGLAGDDVLKGLGGNDVLVGGTGIDQLFGGAGNDTFRVSAGEVMDGEVYSGGSGFDTLQILQPVTNLPFIADFRGTSLSSIEAVDFTGTSGKTALFRAASVGNGLSSSLAVSGESDLDVLQFQMLTKTALDLSGFTFGSWGGTTKIIGDGSAETVTGTSAADFFNLGKGVDIAHGGGGNDGFDVTNAVAGEIFDGGAGTGDWLSAGADVDLRPASFLDIEKLVFGASETGVSVRMDATQFGGGGVSNALIVQSNNLAPNALFVEMGSVTSFDASQMTILPSANTNVANTLVIDGDADNETITGTAFNDILHGAGGDDVLNGGDGRDFLDGDTGIDIMTGGDGDDDYIVDSVDDQVIETSTGGNDFVRSYISYKLSAEVESLMLVGTDAIDATGNAKSNVLIGNQNDNTISGGAGDDMITGHGGKDVMTGGDGIDGFNFMSITDSGVGGGNRDVIIDFEVGVDHVFFGQVDADPSTAGTDSWTENTGGPIGPGQFTITVANGNTMLSFYVDADSTPEMQILLQDVTGVTVTDLEF